jgi:hypothetical protein
MNNLFEIKFDEYSDLVSFDFKVNREINVLIIFVYVLNIKLGIINRYFMPNIRIYASKHAKIY